MNVKDYLSQAYHIDQRISGKLEQIKSLRNLALKASSTLSDMPKNSTRNLQQMEKNIVKMIDLEAEINDDINNLLVLKRDILGTIKKISNPKYQTLLELRYISFKHWEEISSELGYELRYLHKIHNSALKACGSIFKK